LDLVDTYRNRDLILRPLRVGRHVQNLRAVDGHAQDVAAIARFDPRPEAERAGPEQPAEPRSTGLGIADRTGTVAVRARMRTCRIEGPGATSLRRRIPRRQVRSSLEVLGIACQRMRQVR